MAPGLAECLEACAALAVGMQHYALGAELAAAATRLREERNLRRSPAEQADHAAMMAELEHAVAPRSLAAALEAGWRLSIKEAIDKAQSLVDERHRQQR